MFVTSHFRGVYEDVQNSEKKCIFGMKNDFEVGMIHDFRHTYACNITRSHK